MSILIVDYKMPNFVEKCVASVKHDTDMRKIELLTHDNSPPNQNLGFAKANNQLIRRSQGKYLVLLNPDTMVTKGWLGPLLALAGRSDIGIIQLKMLRFDGKIDCTGHKWTWKNGVPQLSNRGEGEDDRNQYDGSESRELPSACFGAVLIKREVFQDIGLLDERFFLFWEDVEFSLRARNSGWKVVYCPESVVYHVRGGSGASVSKDRLPEIIRLHLGYRILLRTLAYDFLGVLVGVKNGDRVYARKKLDSLIEFCHLDRLTRTMSYQRPTCIWCGSEASFRFTIPNEWIPTLPAFERRISRKFFACSAEHAERHAETVFKASFEYIAP